MKHISLNFFPRPELNIEKRFQILKRYNKEQITSYFYIILTLFSLSFFGLFAINPTLSTISNLKRQYEDDQFVEDSLLKKITALNKLGTEYKQIEPHLEVLNLAIPASSKIPDLAAKVSRLGEQDNVVVKRFEVAGIELYPGSTAQKPIQSQKELSPTSANQINTEDNASLTLNIVVEGTEQNANTFLSDIANIDRLITITQFNLEKGEEIAHLSISGKVYFNKKQ